MESELKNIINSSDIPQAYKYYWGYQFDLGVQSLVPHLIKKQAFRKGFSVCEIGSAEGGALHAFVCAGAKNALGTDIAQNRLDMGAHISKLGNMNVDYVHHNIITEEPRPEWIEAYDLVILRDVIEHLDDTSIALENIKKIIKPGGFLLVTFPPYYSPFGGHQHTLAGNFITKLPYIHLLPKPLFFSMINSGRENDIGEVKRLKGIRLTAKKFSDAAIGQGYSIFSAEYYLLRPVFKMKFGLPTVRLTPISALPLVKTLFSLEAEFILQKKK